MTPEKIVAVAERYRAAFIEKGIVAQKHPHGELAYDSGRVLEHCHDMLDGIVQFAEEGRTDKAFRWLGFVQGVLWVAGIYTLDSLKGHSRPDI